MGVNITTIVYLRVLIIQIGSTIILMVVESQETYSNSCFILNCWVVQGWAPTSSKWGYNPTLAGGFNVFFIFTPKPGEMIQFDEHIFQMGGSTTN